MKIIKPSATIIEDELSQLSVYQRIAYCAGVCYQREPNKTEDEAQAFCQKMVKIGHYSTLEMATIHVVFPDKQSDVFDECKFLQVTKNSAKKKIVSGSIRSFMELDFLAALILKECTLSKHWPLFFKPIEKYSSVFSFGSTLASSEETPWQHQHVAVRFIVNRAVSHELVRHRPMSFLMESQRYCRYEDEVVFISPEWWHSTMFEEFDLRELRTWFTDNCKGSEGRYRSMLKTGLKPQQARTVLPNSTKTELIAYANLPQWKHIFKLRCSPAADPEMRRVMIPLEQEFKIKYPEAFGA